MAAKKQPAKQAALLAEGLRRRGRSRPRRPRAPRLKPGQAKAQPKSKGSKNKVLNVWSYDAQGNR